VGRRTAGDTSRTALLGRCRLLPGTLDGAIDGRTGDVEQLGQLDGRVLARPPQLDEVRLLLRAELGLKRPASGVAPAPAPSHSVAFWLVRAEARPNDVYEAGPQAPGWHGLVGSAVGCRGHAVYPGQTVGQPASANGMGGAQNRQPWQGWARPTGPSTLRRHARRAGAGQSSRPTQTRILSSAPQRRRDEPATTLGHYQAGTRCKLRHTSLPRMARPELATRVPRTGHARDEPAHRPSGSAGPIPGARDLLMVKLARNDHHRRWSGKAATGDNPRCAVQPHRLTEMSGLGLANPKTELLSLAEGRR